MVDRALELAALLRLGLGAVLGSVAERDGASIVDALVAGGALRRGQALAVRAYVQHHRAACGCGHVFLAPEEEAFACPACDVTLRRAAGAGPHVAGAAARAPTTGDRVGPLELLEPLGRGAYGLVFRARHVELGRTTALKLLAGAALDPARRKRFEREVVAQARLDHPGIVRVHATYEVGDALACEMELVDGEPLRARLDREGRLPWRDAAALLSKVARALDHAHERQVVHRDLKPENLLLRRADGEPLIADLGLARLTDQASSLTRTGALVGTPLYLAPETVLSSDVGPGADVWALGAILHETLAGEPPFGGDDLLTLLAKICAARRRPLPDDLPPALARICDRALARDRLDRYARALDLALDLERTLRGEPLGRAPRRPLRLRRVAAASSFAAALALCALALAVAGRAPQAGELPTRPPAARAAALAAEARALEHTEPRRALALARSATELAGDDVTLALAMGELRARLGDPAGLLPALARLAPARSADPAFRFDHARALRACGHDAQALEALGAPGDRRAALLAATLLTELDRPEEALVLLRPLVERGAGAERYDPLVAAGAAHLARGAIAEAAESFVGAQELVPTHAAGSLGLAECLLAMGALDAALQLSERNGVAPHRRWALTVGAAARAAMGDGAGAKRLLAEALAEPVGPFACLEGRRFVEALATGRPRGRWARRLLRDARRASYVSALSKEGAAASERLSSAALELLPESSSAWTTRALLDLVRLRDGEAAREPAVRQALARASALAPPDHLARAVDGLRRALTEGVWDESLYPRDVVIDHEQAASGLVCPFFVPAELASSRLHVLGMANDLPRALEVARANEGRGDTPDQVQKLRRRCAAVYERAGDLAAAARARSVETDLAAALVRVEQEGHDPAELDRALEEQPWNAGLRALRGELGCKKSGRASVPALHDFVLAALQSPELTLQPLVDLGREEAVGAAAPDAGVVIRDPELLPLPLGSTREERAATPLVRAILLLPLVGVTTAEGRGRLVRTLAYCDQAEDLVCESPLPRVVRALTLARVGLDGTSRPLDDVGMIRGCPRSTLDLLRARLTGGVDVSSLLAGVRADFVTDRATTWLFARDLTGHARLFRAFAEEPPLAGRLSADVLTTSTPPTAGSDGAEVLSFDAARASGARWTEPHGVLALTPVTPGGAIELALGAPLFEADLLLDPDVTAVHFDVATGRRTIRLEPRARPERRLVPLVVFDATRTQARVVISASGGQLGLVRLLATQPLPGSDPGGFLAARGRDLEEAFSRAHRRPIDGDELQAELARQRPVADALAEWLADERSDDAPRSFVEGAFSLLADRAARPDEVARWVAALDQGWPRADVAAAIAVTADARRRWPR